MRNEIAVSFHRRRGVRGLDKVTIRQKFGNHTIAFLDYRISSRRDYLMPDENTPTAVRFGQGPTGMGVYYGYVNHYETVTDDYGKAYTRMVLVGTSKTMNSMHPSSWEGTTRSNITRDIAARHRLRSIVHDHPYLVENWATGTRSDFQSLKALAEETGYRLWVDGSTLWMIDPQRLLRTASSLTTPLFTRRQVKKIQVLGGSNIPGKISPSQRKVQFGLDYRSNEFFTATSGDPHNPAQVSSNPVTTFSEAQEVADAAERKQQDYYALAATVSGAAKVHPGRLVRFESGTVNTDQSGLWLVNEAVHEITSTTFTTELGATRGRDAHRLMRAPDTVRGASGQMPAIVRDGEVWEAALQEHLHV
jgi:hypothetical protein